MWVGIGVGIGRNRFATGIFNAYALRVTADGGITEAGQCVDAVSGLLQSASLLLVPSGYKGGKLYSQIPTNGNGDLTWTRGSDAFRTNASGLLQRVPWNLLQRSEEFDNAVWTKTGCTISANLTTAPNGTLTADKLIPNNGQSAVSGDSSLLIQSLALNPSVYTYSIYAKAAEFTSIRFRETNFSGQLMTVNLTNGSITGGGSQFVNPSAINVGDGWYRISFTSNSTTLMSLANQYAIRCASTGDGTSGIFIWGAQLDEGTTAQTYLPTTDRLNFPRLSYMYGSCPAVLAEPQRTNLLLQSEDLTNGWSVEGLTITANQTTAPDGNTTADLLQETAVTDVHRVYRTGITTVASTNYAFSFYVKKDTRRYVRLVLNQTTNAAIWAAAQFDLDNQTFTSGVGSGGGTFVSASISPAANGFYRITLVATVTSTITFAFLALSDGTAISSADSRGCNTYAGSISNRIWGWGAQLEAGAYPTTYISTTSATATRVADSFSRNNIYTNGFITSSGGTWFVELRNNIVYTRDTVMYLGVGDTSTLNSNAIFIMPGVTSLSAIRKRVAGAESALYVTTTTTTKIIVKWNGTSCDVFANGTKVVSASPFTTTNMEFFTGSATAVPMFIQQMALYPSPLSDTDCTTITTL